MDGLLVLLGLLAAASLFLGPIGFFIALGHGRRVAALEETLREAGGRLAAIEGRLAAAAVPPPPPVAERVAAEEPPPATSAVVSAVEGASPAPVETPLAAEETAATEQPVAPPPAAPAEEELAAANVATPPPPPPPPPVAAKKPSLEETLGARWTVWVGGVATALGALLLVRYSIAQGYFGPGVRVTLGLVLAAALLGVGEKLRRDEGAAQPKKLFPSAPATLTAAGVVAAFGSLYAAHAVYGFIGPVFAFLALGAVGLFALALASLHGPPLAALGFVGASVAPLLVSSEHPSPWPVVVYLLVVGAATYGLARLRRWLWLALVAAAGGALWTLLFVAQSGSALDLEVRHAAEAMLILQGALAAFFLAFAPHRSADDAQADVDLPSLAALVVYALIGLAVLHGAPGFAIYDAAWVATASLEAAMLAIIGALAAPAAGLTALAGAFLLAALALWPALDLSRALDLPQLVAHWRWPPPLDPNTFASLAIALGLGVAALAGWRLLSGPRLKSVPAACYAGATALTPLLAILIADARLADGAPSGGLAASAAVLAALFAGAASRFRRALDREDSQATRLGLGALSAAAIAAFASGLVFALDGAALTVSLALAAAATAYVAVRLEIPALRWCVAGFGVAVAARLAWEPRIVGVALSPRPIFNWLLFGYGAPAAAFAFAAKLMRTRAEDTPVRVADAAAVLFSAFLVFFEIRHAMNGGDPFAEGSGLVELGLMAVSGFGFALVLTRLDAARSNVVFRYASLIAGALALFATIVGLMLRYNPFLDEGPVEGGVVINALIIAYALPALIAAALWLAARRVRPVWYSLGAAVAAAALILVYVFLQLRVFFHGAAIGYDEGFTLSELGIDASICLALALLLNLSGARDVAALRYQRGLFIASAIVGVSGLAGLENPLLSDEPVAGGVVFNALIVAYLLPGLLTALIARRLGAAAMRIAAILWGFAYVTLETRRAFNDAFIGSDKGASDAEIYAYSAVWLMLGIALLIWGVWRVSREARYASAFFIIATTLKVFIYDFAGLEGVLRALSFIGLGFALIGIGLVYQKWVFGKTQTI